MWGLLRLAPITHIFFPRVQWLEKESLRYLDEWKASVDSREGITPTEKAKMCLSRETLEGLHITGMLVSIPVVNV